MEISLKIGTRPSNLALKQANEIFYQVRYFFPEIKRRYMIIDSPGDRDKSTPLLHMEGNDFFTRELDEAVETGKIDMAVHSAKDLPDQVRPTLKIAAITSCLDPHDAFVSYKYDSLIALPLHSRIGASSLRRQQQLKKFRSDFQIKHIRGNIEERLALLEKSNLDGIIVAACALMRLNKESLITQRIPFEILAPHPLQGKLAVIIRKNDSIMDKLLKPLNNKKEVSV